MPGIVPPYVPSQMLNIPQTSLQAKPVVSIALCSSPWRNLLCSSNESLGGKGGCEFSAWMFGDEVWNISNGTDSGRTIFVDVPDG